MKTHLKTHGMATFVALVLAWTVQAGTVALWEFNETGGTGTAAVGAIITDSSGNGHDGAVAGGDLVYGFDPVFGSYLSFRASDPDRVEVPFWDGLPFAVSGSARTFEAFFRTPGVAGGRVALFGFGGTASAAPQVWFRIPKDGGIHALFRSDEPVNSPPSNNANETTTELLPPTGLSFKDNQWHHVAVVYDGISSGKSIKVYMDNQVVGMDLDIRSGGTFAGGSSNPFQIGGMADFNNSPFLGDIAAMRISDVALTPDQFMGVPSPVSIIITQDLPATLSARAASITNLTVQATGTLPRYQWYKNAATPGDPAAAIPGATSNTLSFHPVQTTDAGNYQVIVRNSGSAATSVVCQVSVLTDIIPPAIATVNADKTFTNVIVKFSEAVTDTALTAGNYAIDNGITVSNVTRVDDSTIRLGVSRLAEGGSYVLTVSGVQDLWTPPNTIPANTPAPFKSFVRVNGFCAHEFWQGAGGGGFLTSLTGDPRFPDSPTWITAEPRWEYGRDGSNDSGTGYGNKLSGWFTPDQTANYVFFACSDEQSHLYLSTDADPANKKLIAVETNSVSWSRNWVRTRSGAGPADKRSDQFAGTEWPTGNTITLQAGQPYYLESLHVENQNDDNVGATFKIEGEDDPADGSAPRLAGALISTCLDPTGASVTIATQPTNQTAVVARTATFHVSATGSSLYATVASYQWQQAAKGSSTFTDIPGATAPHYNTPALTLADDGTQYRVVCSAPPISQTSAVAVLTVIPDTFPPEVVSAVASVYASRVRVRFSEPVEATTALDPFSYIFQDGTFSVLGVTAVDPFTVDLATEPAPTPGASYVLLVSFVADYSGNAMAENTPVPFTAPSGFPVMPNLIAAFDGSSAAPDPADGVTWRDLSGNENHAVNALTNANRRPTLVPNGLNGFPTLRFTRAHSQTLSIAAATGTGWDNNSYSWFFVVKPTFLPPSGGGGANVVRHQSSLHSANWGTYFETPNAVGVPALTANGRTTGADSVGTSVWPVLSNTWMIGQGYLDGAAGNVYVRMEDAVVGTSTDAINSSGTATGIGTPIATWIGSANNGGYFDGEMAEVLVYRGVLDDAQRAEVEAYLRNKYFAPPMVAISANAGSVAVHFTGVLQAAPSLNNTFQDLTNASPLVLPPDSLTNQMFFRARRP